IAATTEPSSRRASPRGFVTLAIVFAALAALGTLGYVAVWAPRMDALAARAEAAARLAESRHGAIVALERELAVAKKTPEVAEPPPAPPAALGATPKRPTT